MIKIINKVIIAAILSFSVVFTAQTNVCAVKYVNGNYPTNKQFREIMIKKAKLKDHMTFETLMSKYEPEEKDCLSDLSEEGGFECLSPNKRRFIENFYQESDKFTFCDSDIKCEITICRGCQETVRMLHIEIPIANSEGYDVGQVMLYVIPKYKISLFDLAKILWYKNRFSENDFEYKGLFVQADSIPYFEHLGHDPLCLYTLPEEEYRKKEEEKRFKHYGNCPKIMQFLRIACGEELRMRVKLGGYCNRH